MNFYELWDFARCKEMNESSFLIDFMRKTDFSDEIFLNGTHDELLLAISILLSTSIDSFIELVDGEYTDLTPDSIVQFSTFEHALFSINKLIHFHDGGMSFSELGKEIMNSKQEGACKKYGENHSKLAAVMSLVKLERDGSFIVNNTSLGDFSISMEKEDKIALAKRLLLRNSFILRIISDAKNGNCDYMELASHYLSESTALRRKGNVRFLVNLILEGTDYQYLLKNIVW